MNEKNFSRPPVPNRKRSQTMRFAAYVYAGMAAVTYLSPAASEHAPMFVIIATVFAVGAEILQEFGR